MSELEPKSTNWLRISVASRSHLVNFTSRDWKVLSHPDCPPGREWLNVFGFSGPPGTSVAKGLEVGYAVAGDRLAMIATSERLLSHLRGEEELLRYDYVVTVRPGLMGKPESRFGGGGVGGIATVSGQRYGLMLSPGRCYLESVPTPSGRQSVIDLRRERRFVADGGKTFAVGRRTQGLAWPTELPALLEFLSGLPEPTVAIYNHHR